MRNETITYNSLASPSVGDAKLVAGIEVPTSLLRAGQNVLAVELHQNTITSPDVVFGAQIDAVQLAATTQAYEESSQEWLEIYNRSDQPVDFVVSRFHGQVGIGPQHRMPPDPPPTPKPCRHRRRKVVGCPIDERSIAKERRKSFVTHDVYPCLTVA